MAELGLQEIIAVAAARGISLPEEAMQRTMTMDGGLVSQSTALLQRDVMEGRSSEPEAQIEAVVRFGQERDVATRQHTFKDVEHVENKMVMQGVDQGVEGVDDGLAWSLAISKKDGRAVLSASGDGVAYVVFDLCTPIKDNQ
jgi:hypothetical protein